MDKGIMIMFKRILGLILSIGLMFSLSGCSGDWTGEEVSEFITWNLNDVYLGEFDKEYMAMIGMDEETLGQYYLEGIAGETSVFVEYFALKDPSEAEQQRITDFYVELYKHSNYNVPTAVKNEDGSFAVNVAVAPLMMVQEIFTIAEANLEKFETPEWNEFVISTAEKILTAGEFNVGEVVDVPVAMILDETDTYTVSQEDWDTIDFAIITY